MKRLFLVSCIVSVTLLSTCKKEDTEPDNNTIIDTISEATCLQFVNQLSNSVSDSNLIASITEENDFSKFLLEDGTQFSIPSAALTKHEIDNENWSVSVLLKYGIKRNYPIRGTSLIIDEDSINLNPYLNAPLTALVSFSTPFPRKIKMEVKRKLATSAEISNVFEEFSNHHKIPVFGLFCDYDNKVEISILDLHGNLHLTKEIKIKTEECVRSLSGEMEVVSKNYSAEQKNRLFLVQNTIYDASGEVRWITKHNGVKYYRLANNKIGIQINSDRGAYPVYGPAINIIDLFGRSIKKYDVPNRMHHEIQEKTPGGNLLVCSNAQPYSSKDDDTEDLIIEIDRLSGEIVKQWDLREIFDPERQRLWTESINDWCHLNSLQYDSTDNIILLSSKLQYFVSKIDYNTGEIKWILGNHENWKKPWQQYLLTPLNFDTSKDDNHDWVYAQHMPRLTNEGNIIIYDNGKNRPGGAYTRAVEYKVDPVNMTVEKVWDYHLNDVAGAMGSIHKYEDNSVHIGHAGKGKIYEVSWDGELLFEANMKNYYRSYPIEFY